MVKLFAIAVALTFALSPMANAEGDAAKGKRIFNKCKACHAVGDNAANKIGPVLNGIVGAAAGQNADFSYSDAMIAAAEGGLVWDEATLVAFLTKPGDVVDGTKIAFAGLRKEQDIADVTAYLATFE